MILALLLAASSPTALDAERSFAADAQRIGQWTAFRKYADRDAVMFTPQAVWAYNFLKGRKNPPRSLHWWPAHSFLSCDGRTAVNTGPWFNPNGTQGGYFTTVWQRTGGRWRWVYDGGGPLGTNKPSPRKAGKAQVHRAVCGKAPGAPVIPPPPLSSHKARTSPEDNGRGESADKTIGWDWKVAKDGSRRFRVFQWNGQRYAQVLVNDIPAQ
jgi:hypothetical protein